MSFSLKVYALDIKSVAALFGSGKSEFGERILKNFSKEIQEINDWSEADISAEIAIAEVLKGSLSSSSGEIYAQVLELICKEIGEELLSNEWSELSMNWIMDINLEPSLPISALPIPVNYPYVLTISNRISDEFIENFRLLDYEFQAMNQAETWFKEIEKAKKDLMLFFY
jgi:hypothetical protein